MATPRGVPVHFISSSAFAMLQKDTSELSEVLPSSFGPPAAAELLMKNAIGCAASKLMGEIPVERSAHVPGIVYRFPNIVEPDPPEEIPLIALDNLLHADASLPALDLKRWVGELDIMDIRDVVPDSLAKASVHDPGELIAVHNYCSENRYLLSDLVSMCETKLGGRIDALPTKEWMKMAIVLGTPRGVKASFTCTEVFLSLVLRKGRVVMDRLSIRSV
ncbi:uncharacterized protein RSE6_13021 [Rhynchosporium secalis]|uniref:Uncharacterized protein n=1 Tax=Rhynchosporium secalis TaxID=38038 RepID=A0A1E1MRV3_RHYSE|nr:uncharacterized protein RSE6_13021 [Rhynchosporium secalis]